MSLSAFSHLECPECGRTFRKNRIQTICRRCNSPLLAHYDLEQAAATLTPAALAARPRGMFRWAEILPLESPEDAVTLGEGDTPLLPLQQIGVELGLPHLFVKDESRNPTGSFKARGLAMAVSRARELGVRGFVIPTAGNAGGALAAYAARAGLPAKVFMPQDAPAANQREVAVAGAELVLVDGLISDAAALARTALRRGWLDVSTFKEPYRVEGKKTMGLELAEAFGWELPDVILYPTGGGTGLVGMWKAFAELEALGLIGAKRPRMVSVQAAGCAPIVRAWETGAVRAEPWENAATLAAGLRVPSVFADRLILRALRESNGLAVAVPDDEIVRAWRDLAAYEGIWAAPEGAATLAGLRVLLQRGLVSADEKIVLFNTGSGLKYQEEWQA